MPLLCDFPAPSVEREAFAGGYTSKGVPLLTLDELEQYSSGKGSRRERTYKCPFCGASERAFHVNIETGAFNCKRSSCAVKGRLREFWPSLDATRLHSQNRVFDAFALKPLRQPAPLDAVEADGDNWRAQWESAAPLDAIEAEPARCFLIGRGLSVEIAQQSGARFSRNWAPSPEGKTYRGGAAVLFPLLDMAGELVAVGGRYLMDGATPKARVGGRGETGVFHCAVNGKRPLDVENIVAVEGPADALALASVGVPSVAFHGTVAPVWWHRACAFKAFWAALDNDTAGDKGAGVALDTVNGYARKSVRLTPTGANDWAELLETSGADALRACLPLELLDAPQNRPKNTTAGTDSQPPAADAPPDALESARARLARLEAALVTAGACRSIWRASRRVEREQPGFWAGMNARSRNELSVAYALLDCGLDPLEEAPR